MRVEPVTDPPPSEEPITPYVERPIVRRVEPTIVPLQVVGIYDRLARVEADMSYGRIERGNMLRRITMLEETVDALEDKENDTKLRAVRAEERARARAELASEAEIAKRAALTDAIRRRVFWRKTVVGGMIAIIVGAAIALIKYALSRTAGP